ncbi:MAG: hypothetical protein EXR67_07640 [Dehalococcoidia bacterium]|nr:hypothetical protein [Dehalococcoidia bacterium]
MFFVCTGNICRSRMAAAFFKHIVAQKGVSIQASSCGLDVQSHGATSKAVETAYEHDANTQHTSRMCSMRLWWTRWTGFSLCWKRKSAAWKKSSPAHATLRP